MLGVVVSGAVYNQGPANGNQAPVPIIFCSRDGQMLSALGARESLDFVFCDKIISRLFLIMAGIVFDEGYFMK